MSDKILIRPSVETDATYLKNWFEEPGVLRWFPMIDEREIVDAVQVWMNYSKLGASLTAEWEGTVCGMSCLYIQPFKKLSHQCLFSVIVDQNYRNKQVGTTLLKAVMSYAKEKFHIELLHLEVYEGNPARRLYERLGFVVSGEQKRFIKEAEQYLGKTFMYKFLLG